MATSLHHNKAPLEIRRPPSVTDRLPPPVLDDEELILDERAEMAPAQMVENKLSGMLKHRGLRVSQLPLRALITSRS